MTIDHPLLTKFEGALALGPAERSALAGLPFREEAFLAGDGVAWSGGRTGRCSLVLDGVLATSKPVGDGRVQVTGFHIRGDMPDLYGLGLGRLDADVVAMTPCRVAWFAHDALLRLSEEHPRLGAHLWRLSLVDAAVSSEWVANVGRRDATSRLAHLLCEMMARMEAVGLADGSACQLGLTQRDLSEASALSVVHVNRVMQELRARALVSLGQGRLVIHDRAGLEAVGDFRPDYLHLPEAEGRAA
jgi:CRP-like cAMP-binding protein